MRHEQTENFQHSEYLCTLLRCGHIGFFCCPVRHCRDCGIGQPKQLIRWRVFCTAGSPSRSVRPGLFGQTAELPFAAQFHPSNFPGDGLGQRVSEFDLSGVFVGGGLFFDEVLNLDSQRI